MEGVYALADLSCDNGMNCPQQNTEEASLAGGRVWLTREYSLCPGNNGCTSTGQVKAQVEVAAFGSDGGIRVIESTPEATADLNAMSAGVGVTADGSAVYFAYDDLVAGSVVVHALTPDGGDAGVITATTTPGVVIGVAADTRAAIVGVAASASGGQNSDNASFDFGASDSNSAGTSGSLYRVDFADGGITPRATTFDTTFTRHLWVADTANVYWIGSGSVWSAPIDLSSAPAGKGAVTGGAPVGIAVANGVVSWSMVLGSTSCGSGPCTFNALGCQVWSAGTLIYDTSTGAGSHDLCFGLATDASDAYFAIVRKETVPCNGCGTAEDVFTTGIGRVSLTGPPTQAPAVFPLATNRFYGPRRFLVDDTYVYGIDPAYVLRIAKSAFPK